MACPTCSRLFRSPPWASHSAPTIEAPHPMRPDNPSLNPNCSACTERKTIVAKISFSGFLSGCHRSCAFRSMAFERGCLLKACPQQALQEKQLEPLCSPWRHLAQRPSFNSRRHSRTCAACAVFKSAWIKRKAGKAPRGHAASPQPHGWTPLLGAKLSHDMSASCVQESGYFSHLSWCNSSSARCVYMFLQPGHALASQP